jgi:hypothetical protein
MRVLATTLILLGFALPCDADDFDIKTAEVGKCTRLTEPTVYWIDCESSCPDGSKVIGGNCSAPDTRGYGLAVESFGIREGNKFFCRYVDARLIGTGGSVPPAVTLAASANCLHISK